MDQTQVIQAAWSAFPLGWFMCAGTKSRCGANLVSLPSGLVWVLPPAVAEGTACLAPAESYHGNVKVRELRDSFQMLPDIKDTATFLMLLDHVARRAGLGTDNGLHWTPRAKGKERIGWAISTPSRQRMIPSALVPSHIPEIALLQAIAATNCSCTKTGRAQCPEHGPSVWR